MSLAGKTGSGKTYAAEFLLKKIRRKIVIDPKQSPAIDKWNLLPFDKESIKLLEDGKDASIRIWEPPAIDKDGFPVWDAIFELAWDLAPITIYIDEMYSVAKNGKMSYPLRRLYTQGREHDVGLWASTQRPKFVPKEMFTEAEWGFVFMLKREDDRKEIAADSGYDLIEEPIRDLHGFWVYYETWPEPIYYPELVVDEKFEPKPVDPYRIPVPKRRELMRT